MKVAGIVDDVVVGGSTVVGRVDIWVIVGHGVFTTIHENASIAHVGCSRVGDGNGFGDALVLESTDGVNVKAPRWGPRCQSWQKCLNILIVGLRPLCLVVCIKGAQQAIKVHGGRGYVNGRDSTNH